jgi:alkylation response protein AidB-like acyl-CoA dehydrogenase
VWKKARLVDKENHKLRRYNQWGQDVSEFQAHPLYLENVADLYGSGIVGWNYQKENDGRRAPMALIAGWGSMSGGADIGVSCPICMTDGARWLLERFATPALRDKFVPHLTSTNPAELFTAGMLLTEITGGSDVGASRSTAKKDNTAPQNGSPAERWLITGEKWFSSNAGADVFMVLARPEGAPGGPKGLALFCLPRKKEDGTQNNFSIRRIKDKVGTRNVATAEILFEDAEAYLVGEAQKGIYYMMDMVNLSRLYNAIASVGTMSRSFIEAKRYAEAREAFGKRIDGYPAVKETFTDLAVQMDACNALTFEAATAFDNAEAAGWEAGEAWSLLRILTPMCKYRTGEKACDFTREAAVIFAGNGTIEDFGIERLYRDSLILPIWEGTANIQVLDILRSMRKENAHEVLLKLMDEKLATLNSPLTQPLKAYLEEQKGQLLRRFTHWLALPQDELLLHAKKMVDRLIDWCMAVCLAAEAQFELNAENNARKVLVAVRFIRTSSLWQGEDPLSAGDRFALDHYTSVVLFETPAQEEVQEEANSLVAQAVRI